MSKELDQKAAQMPHPEYVEAAPSSGLGFSFDRQSAVTISWQWVLPRISEALIARNPRQILRFLLADIDYLQLNHNAIEDISSLVGKPVAEDVLIETQAKITLLRHLISEGLHHTQSSNLQLDRCIDESGVLINQLKSLEVVGLGAFMVAVGLQLGLLEERAKSDLTAWSRVRSRAIEHSQWATDVTPRLFRLSIGRIDKACRCTKRELSSDGKVTEFECRYFDGKDVHLFRQLSPNVGFECNKHRLQRFHTVADRVTQSAAYPVREALKQWQALAASI